LFRSTARTQSSNTSMAGAWTSPESVSNAGNRNNAAESRQAPQLATHGGQELDLDICRTLTRAGAAREAGSFKPAHAPGGPTTAEPLAYGASFSPRFGMGEAPKPLASSSWATADSRPLLYPQGKEYVYVNRKRPISHDAKC